MAAKSKAHAPRPHPDSDEVLAGAVAAASAGLVVDDYLQIRDCGATHAEAISACTLGMQAIWYCASRANGVTHQEAVTFNELIPDLDFLAQATEVGSTAGQVIAALRDYIPREIDFSGVPDNDILLQMQKVRRECVAVYYPRLREIGLSHAKALAVLAADAQPFSYITLREDGLKHKPALRAAVPYTIDVTTYA